MRCWLLLPMCVVSVRPLVCLSRGWTRRRVQCVRSHSVQPLWNYFGLLFFFFTTTIVCHNFLSCFAIRYKQRWRRRHVHISSTLFQRLESVGSPLDFSRLIITISGEDWQTRNDNTQVYLLTYGMTSRWQRGKRQQQQSFFKPNTPTPVPHPDAHAVQELLHPAAVVLSPIVLMLFAILDTFILLSISLFLCMYII